ncbi:MAG: hypothetical protein VX768_13400 [Planctomycetota bacterium]|nr:hypothetical protein [Planctomycetota bacterium]
MGKSRGVREKLCHSCSLSAGILYRVRIRAGGEWLFVCRGCLQKVRPANPDYQYGGTWKKKKRH